MTKLFVEDVRKAPDKHWYIVRSYSEFTKYIKNNGVPEFISFDHDLGSGKSGLDCVKWLIENCYRINDFDCHSANPIGKEIKTASKYPRRFSLIE